jgi:murein DD-endopeptidase MepM/ murein hydrolase activator NlpD
MTGGEAQARATGRPQRASHGGEPAQNTRAAHPHKGVFARPRPQTLPFVTFTTSTRTHSYAIHPVLWLGGALVAASLALAGIASGLYVAFHDDILEIAINRPIRMEQSYEDRIAALRSEIDRINSRQLLDQDAFEGKIAQLTIRQDDLRAQEARVAGLLAKANEQNIHVANGMDIGIIPGQLGGNLAAPTATSSVPSPGATPAQLPVPALPHPIDDVPLRSSWLMNTGSTRSDARLTERSSPGVQIARVEQDLDRMRTETMNSIAVVTGLAETNSRRIERVVDRLGLRMADAETPVPQIPVPKARPTDGGNQAAAAAQDRGVGGPLVPIMDEREIIARAEAALSRLSQLKQGIGLLPLGQPISGQIEVTSPFGERPDPFLGTLAMHTGVDFRAGFGDAVVATASGVVTEASRQGGYGNMVEIDHGNGIATRYGHLSQFAVVVGQKVKAGHIIGYVGSTGRSTAPHLHYETRVSGVAVNPESYLQAGNQLRPLLN